MVVTYKEVSDAAEADTTICPACGTRDGEAGYACFYCDSAIVRDASEVQSILDLVEPRGDDDD